MASGLSTVCNFDITPSTIARAMVTPIHHTTRSLYSSLTSATPIHHNWDGSSYHWNTATTNQCRHNPSPLGLQQYPLSTSCSRSYSYKPSPTGPTQLDNIGAISNGEEYSLRWKSILYFDGGWQRKGLAKMWTLRRYVMERDSWGDKSIIVWGAIEINQKSWTSYLSEYLPR